MDGYPAATAVCSLCLHPNAFDCSPRELGRIEALLRDHFEDRLTFVLPADREQGRRFYTSKGVEVVKEERETGPEPGPKPQLGPAPGPGPGPGRGAGREQDQEEEQEEEH